MGLEMEILFIEDNASDAELTIRALKRNNIANRIIHLKDGAEALEYIFSEDNLSSSEVNPLPKVILLDLKMPKISGIEVLKKIKSDERTKSIPVVVLTSSKEHPDIKKCYDLGVNSYVVKPVDFDSFSKAISNLGIYWMLINEQQK